MALATDHLVPVHCEQLELGMYVAELDRSWLHTPFETRGFLVTQATQIDVLRRCCDYVYIDPARSEATDLPNVAPAEADYRDLSVSAEDGVAEDLLPLNGCREVLYEAAEHVGETIRAARRAGRLDITPIDRNLDTFVDHVLEWSDAVQWLLATEPAPGYLNRRSLGTAIYSIIFGRQLGFDHEVLRELALGSLILDVGKTGVPITILSKPQRLNSVERSFVRRHVDKSVALIRLTAQVEPRIVDMVGAHHERLDGSGYPHHKSGTEIPLFARLAGISDTYDALTQDRSYANARSGHAALRYLNTWRDIKFDAALIDEFIHAVGVYPVGTGVELVDGSFGIVCRHNRAEPKRPDVLVTRSSDGRALSDAEIVESAPHRRIRRALPAAVLVR